MRFVYCYIALVVAGTSLCALTVMAQESARANVTSNEDNVVLSVKARAVVGDVAALQELKAVPVEKALAVLETFVSGIGPDQPELRKAAASMMANLKVEPIYEQRLGVASAERTEAVNVLLQRLAIIKSRRAVRVIASFLYDDRMPAVEEDVHYASYSAEAAMALG